MSRYIDADALIKRMEASPVFPNLGTDGFFLLGCVTDLIADVPAADVVEVVRCKDCKKWEKYENTSGAGYCHNKKYCFTYGTMLDREFTPITMPDDYCSYGERKEK